MDEIKRGDEPIVTTLKRGIKGLVLHIKTHPVVEEFFLIASADDRTPISVYGRLWSRVGDGEPLEAYELPPSMGNVTMLSNRVGYRIDQPGRDLIKVDQMTGAKTINMSFLRLVGTSQGVALQISGVFSSDEVEWLGREITNASQAIYAQYVKAMEVSCTIIDDLPPRQVTNEIDLRNGN